MVSVPTVVGVPAVIAVPRRVAVIVRPPVSRPRIIANNHNGILAAQGLFAPDLSCGDSLEFIFGHRLRRRVCVGVEPLVINAVLELLHGPVLPGCAAGSRSQGNGKQWYKSPCHKHISCIFAIFARRFSDLNIDYTLYIDANIVKKRRFFPSF